MSKHTVRAGLIAFDDEDGLTIHARKGEEVEIPNAQVKRLVELEALETPELTKRDEAQAKADAATPVVIEPDPVPEPKPEDSPTYAGQKLMADARELPMPTVDAPTRADKQASTKKG